ncbi:MAG TPA: RnfH family protein [Pseudomonadales bacterium]|nr:RnfH family protein [Pseudomonadales bacterium]
MKRVHVEVVYAQADVQHVAQLVLPVEATVADALNRVRGLPEFAGANIEEAPVGVFGTLVTDRTQRLNEGDRVEIYRPLTVDPMTARRLRASRRAE